MESYGKNENKEFNDIVSFDDFGQDRGIEEHRIMMLEIEEAINAKIKNDGLLEIDTKTMQDAERCIDSWIYFDEVGVVYSTRAKLDSTKNDEHLNEIIQNYVGSSSASVMIEKDPDTEDRFCNLDKIRLRSSQITYELEESAGKLDGIRFYYEFVLAEGDTQAVKFLVHPNDMLHQAYKNISSLEATERLRHLWPLEFELIEQIVCDDSMSINERVMLVHQSCEQLLSNEKFREYVELFINDMLFVNTDHPYAVKITNQFILIDDYEGDAESWKQFEIEKGTLDCYMCCPLVIFKENDKEILAYIVGEVYNNESGFTDPEIISVLAENFTKFRQTWKDDSIAKLIYGQAQTEFVENTTEDETQDEGFEIVRQSTNTPAEVSPRKEYLQQLELLEVILDKIQTAAQNVSCNIYYSAEKALNAAEALDDYIVELLKDVINLEKIRLEVSGMGIVTNYIEIDNPDPDRAQDTISLTVNPDQQYRYFDNSETIECYFDNKLPHVAIQILTDEDEDGKVRFKILTFLRVRKPDLIYNDLHCMGMLLNYQKFIENAYVSLQDRESTNISICDLEDARQQQAALKQAEREYGESSSVMNRLIRLENFFDNGKRRQCIELEASCINRFPKELAKHIGRHGQKPAHKLAAPALAALDAILSGKVVECESSEVYYQKGDASFKLDTERCEKLSAWQIIDIKLADDNSEIMMFIQSLGDPEVGRFVPLSAINQFKFRIG